MRRHPFKRRLRRRRRPKDDRVDRVVRAEARARDKIHPPGSPEWKAYLTEHKQLGTVLMPARLP
jgi:hypothetical protein